MLKILWKFYVNLSYLPRMKIKQYDIWLANLNPGLGTEPGKTRPVVIIQADFLNTSHPSAIICPVTSQIHSESHILRVHLAKEQLDKTSDVLVDQIRAIDNKRLIKKIGQLTSRQISRIRENLKIVLDLT